MQNNLLHPLTTASTSRRHFLRDCSVGTGKIALASLLANETLFASPKSNAKTGLPGNIDTHFPGKAKAVIHLFMAGAPSQLELFTEKPTLTKLECQ
ncbi:MAG: DUF1501 domain-containing protein, partial [Planctomycetaceae bacterium]|nr:DUF1501 domain-containing protein [Planctomycetaceae bacterium]